MHASINTPAHAVTVVEFTAKNRNEGYPRYTAYEHVDVVAPADEIVTRLAVMGHAEAQIIESEIVCNRCRHGWEGMLHEAC